MPRKSKDQEPTILQPPKRRKPGRPKGSLNKKTIERMQAAQVQMSGNIELDAYRRKMAGINRRHQEVSLSARDIAPLPTTINWERRLACKQSLRLFCEYYLKPTFYLDWSDDQLKCIKKTEHLCLEQGKFALAMPRGGGKTAICRAAIIWATAYGHKRYPYFIGSKQPNARQTLHAIKMQWFRNRLLLEDFPEIAYPILRIENRYHMARGQLFYGEGTEIMWAQDEVRYPCLLMPDEVAEWYWNHDPESVYIADARQMYIAKSAGCNIGTAGIDGSIRGTNEVHPATLEEVRPDLILLDDIQKDQRAESLISVEKLCNLIDGAVEGLAGPDKSISCLMPCTVIREGDVSDTYLDPAKRPDWNGERCRLVASWPEGITDSEITKDTPAGEHWNEYGMLRQRSLAMFGNNKLGTEYYEAHREIMDAGFVVTWSQRYDKKTCISAQQKAMDLRLDNPTTFGAEYLNIGKSLVPDNVSMVTSETLRNKIISLPRGVIPIDASILVSFIDVQDEFLAWGTLACSTDFTGTIIDYGTWPAINHLVFTRDQANSWNMISKLFFHEYPQYREKAVKLKGGRIKAPLAPKIYFALRECHKMLKAKRYVKADEFNTEMAIQSIAVDARWGDANEPIRRYVREQRDPDFQAYYGASISPFQNQLEEYTLTPGWLFEHQKNPLVKLPMWVRKIGKDGQPYFFADVDRGKDFLFSRLGIAPGQSGSISLFQAAPEAHAMLAIQVCDSEYPEAVTARGMTKNKWTEREGGPDNEYLDVLVGLMMLASYKGAYLTFSKPGVQKRKRSLRALYDQKRARKNK